jgi:oxaloacetate decarboxylase (Na+ extruding) subunit gamma
MAENLLLEGTTLMLVGMGTVFVFLTILVVAMAAMSNLVTRFSAPSSHGDITENEVAAISAAIARHRRK